MNKLALLVVVAVVASVLGAGAAIAEPKIRFISPSAYGGAGASAVLSDQEDRDGTAHIVAWVKEVPANPLVEFELQPAVGNAVTVTAARAGTDAWEAAFDLAGGTPDGQYTLRAILYNGTTQVAVTEMPVSVNRDDIPPPPAAETLELTYPGNAGPAGFFNPKGGRPNTLIEVATSEGTRQVRGFYTASDPGDDPVWKLCGTARVSNRNATIRCVLNDTDSVLDVSAIAAVANTTPPPADPQTVGDESGDAHRVTPYVQVPTSVNLDPSSLESEIGRCVTLQAQVLDQNARPIAALNVDVHAVGPSDQLRFATAFDQTGQVQQNSKFQAPDKGVHASENAFNCASNDALNKQGDHNRPGSNDDKHIESVDNTNNNGVFSFALYSDQRGGTSVTVWADPDDDDALSASEATGGASLGWGQPPPPPQKQIFIDPSSAQATVGSCQRVVVLAKQGGAPLSAANVDVHATGPDQTAAFCTADGQSDSARVPDQGEHTAGAHSDGSIHLEGETDAQGRFVFGVTSGSQGAMELIAWLDETDDDSFAASEPTVRGEIGWGGREQRDISLDANRRRVRSGRNVRFTGSISASPACEALQEVRLQARRGGRFRTIRETTTDENGDYGVSTKVKKTTRFRALAPATNACSKAVSRAVKIRTR